MKTRGKVLLATLSAAMLVTASVMGTLAYLQDSKSVTNTFTVGNVTIKLDEAPVDANGSEVSGDRITDGNEYKLMPGHDYDKDPTVTVTGTEPAWLFVKVDNGIAAIEAKTTEKKFDGNDYATILEQMDAKGWKAVADGIYAYTKEAVDPTESVVVFEEFMVSGTVNNDTLATYATSANAANAIKITAYAVQADGFETAAEAWEAAKGAF